MNVKFLTAVSGLSNNTTQASKIPAQKKSIENTAAVRNM